MPSHTPTLLQYLRTLFMAHLIEEGEPFVRPNGERVHHLLVDKTTVWTVDWPAARDTRANDIAGAMAVARRVEDHIIKLRDLCMTANQRVYEWEAAPQITTYITTEDHNG